MHQLCPFLHLQVKNFFLSPECRITVRFITHQFKNCDLIITATHSAGQSGKYKSSYVEDNLYLLAQHFFFLLYGRKQNLGKQKTENKTKPSKPKTNKKHHSSPFPPVKKNQTNKGKKKHPQPIDQKKGLANIFLELEFWQHYSVC